MRTNQRQINDEGAFMPFVKLPIELRRMVWTFALPISRKVFLTSDDYWYFTGTERTYSLIEYGVKAHGPVPVVLRVNQESRALAQKHYLRILGTILQSPIYFDFAADTLHLADSGAILSYSGIADQGDFEERMEIEDLERKLRFLSIGGTPLNWHAHSSFARFQNLEVLTLGIPTPHINIGIFDDMKGQFEGMWKTVWMKGNDEGVLEMPRIEFVSEEEEPVAEEEDPEAGEQNKGDIDSFADGANETEATTPTEQPAHRSTRIARQGRQM